MTTSDNSPPPAPPGPMPPLPRGHGPPTGRPRPVSAADREAFDALAKESLPAVRSMAAAWRTGLAALVTLVTTGIILKGRTDTTSLALPWRIAVTLAIGGGLALAVLGLWHALAAEAGARARLRTLDDIRAGYASVQAYQVGQAADAGRRLRPPGRGRRRPRAAPGRRAAHLVGADRPGQAVRLPEGHPPRRHRLRQPEICDGGTLRLTVADTHKPAAIPLTAVTNITVTSTCP